MSRHPKLTAQALDKIKEAAQLGLSSNGKVGNCFDLLEGYTCPGASSICLSYCYVLKTRQAMTGPLRMRAERTKLVKRLLKEKALVKALILLIRDLGVLRIHSAGDFFDAAYTRAWREAASRTTTRFWTYTRSWKITAIQSELDALAALPNVAIWLSCDESSYLACMAYYRSHRQYAGIAYMQTPGEEAEEVSHMLTAALKPANLVIFPAHSSGANLRKGVTVLNVPNCPAIIDQGIVDHKSTTPACLQCRKCLPGEK